MQKIHTADMERRRRAGNASLLRHSRHAALPSASSRAGKSTSPSLQRADAQRFQSWIRSQQNPADCSAAVGAITRQDYFHVLGLGAQMVSLKFNLVYALLQGMVYHLPTSHYVNPLRCPSRSFECYFEAPSNCTRTSHAQTVDVKIHWCFDLPRRRLAKLAGLRAVHSKAWFNAQLAAFLFRPNAGMHDTQTHPHSPARCTRHHP